ncbi:hypothetical protein OBV_05170 [Oscillibacter valericigenes Sjm18-20]|nr:hypothetical protein OBV_05170 [Oscillibacter valericigenes Sjm18-20]
MCCGTLFSAYKAWQIRQYSDFPCAYPGKMNDFRDFTVAFIAEQNGTYSID